jgi:hypothetical protein
MRAPLRWIVRMTGLLLLAACVVCLVLHPSTHYRALVSAEKRVQLEQIGVSPAGYESCPSPFNAMMAVFNIHGSSQTAPIEPVFRVASAACSVSTVGREHLADGLAAAGGLVLAGTRLRPRRPSASSTFGVSGPVRAGNAAFPPMAPETGAEPLSPGWG